VKIGKRIEMKISKIHLGIKGALFLKEQVRNGVALRL